MNFKDWWEHNKSEYFYSEEDLAEDAYVTGYSEKQVILSDLLAERTTELTKCKYKNEVQQAELVTAKERIAKLELAASFDAVIIGLGAIGEGGFAKQKAALAAHDVEVRKDALLEFAYKWLPNLRQKAPQSSLAQTEYNLAIDDAVKHALRMAEGKK